MGFNGYVSLFRLGAALLVLALPAGAFAKCASFPVLSKMIDSVSQLRGIDTWEGVAQTSLVINALTQNFIQDDVDRKLKELSIEDKLPMLMQFKEKTASLAQIASYDGPEALHSFMDSSEYRPFYVEARDLLTMACDLASEGENSEFATRNIPLEQDIDFAAYLRSLAPPVSIAQVVTFGAGLTSLTCFMVWLRNRRITRDRRISKRYACEIPATIKMDGRSMHVMIVDISQAGANVHCKEKIPVDTQIELEFSDIHRTANVKWSNDQFAGILMNRLIGEAKIKKLIETSAPEMKKRKAS